MCTSLCQQLPEEQTDEVTEFRKFMLSAVSPTADRKCGPESYLF